MDSGEEVEGDTERGPYAKRIWRDAPSRGEAEKHCVISFSLPISADPSAHHTHAEVDL